LTRAWRLLLAAFTSTLTLSACGLGLNSSSTTTSNTHPATTSIENNATYCTTDQLKIVLGVANVAMGHVGQEVRFENTSTSSCVLTGYPSLQLVDASGHPLATHINDGSGYIVPSLPVRRVVLAPHRAAAFLIGYSDATGYGAASCPKSAFVKIFPPRLHVALTVAWHLQPYGGATIATLRCGELTVSPVALAGAIKW